MNKNKDIKHLIGCTAAIDAKGILRVHPELKTFKIGRRSAFSVYPEYMIIGDDGKGNVRLTSDGLFVSLLPKKFIKIISTK
jgi:hypothetical protein